MSEIVRAKLTSKNETCALIFSAQLTAIPKLSRASLEDGPLELQALLVGAAAQPFLEFHAGPARRPAPALCVDGTTPIAED